jgi:hypothetical protein
MPHDAAAAFYRSADVRERIAEYCGVTRRGDLDAWSAAAYGGARARGHPEGAPVAVPLRAVESLYAEGADVCRSLADRRGTLLLLDLDYVDPRDPSRPYREPEVWMRRWSPSAPRSCPRSRTTGWSRSR